MARLVFIVVLFLITNIARAVELSETEYQLAKEDIILVLMEQDPQLAFLQADTDAERNIRSFRTANVRQGGFKVRLPFPKENGLILQIPHGIFDLHTKEIAELWWQQGIADVLMYNTEQRYKTKRSDLSRLRYSLFTAFAAALLDVKSHDAIASAHIVQLHGFNAIKRQTPSGGHADFILSNGTLLPTTYLQGKQICLRDNGGLLARIYGRDVFELGATINPVGRLINAVAQQRVTFLHIEMPLSIRTGLVQQRLPLAAIKCLVGI